MEQFNYPNDPDQTLEDTMSRLRDYLTRHQILALCRYACVHHKEILRDDHTPALLWCAEHVFPHLRLQTTWHGYTMQRILLSITTGYPQPKDPHFRLPIGSILHGKANTPTLVLKVPGVIIRREYHPYDGEYKEGEWRGCTTFGTSLSSPSGRYLPESWHPSQQYLQDEEVQHSMLTHKLVTLYRYTLDNGLRLLDNVRNTYYVINGILRRNPKSLFLQELIIPDTDSLTEREKLLAELDDAFKKLADQFGYKYQLPGTDYLDENRTDIYFERLQKEGTVTG